MEKPDTGKDLAQGELERARQRAAELEAALAACLQGAFSFSVLESIPSPIFVKDEEFRLVYVNRAVGELGGFPPEYLLGKSDYEYLCKEEADVCRAGDAEVLASGVVRVSQEELTLRGQTRQVQVVKSRFVDRVTGRRYIVGYLTDNTESRNLEEVLRRAERDHRNILDSVNAMIWYMDRAGRVTRANRQAAAHCGTSVQGMLGRTVHDLFPPDFAVAYDRDVQKVLATGKPLLGVVEPGPYPDGSTGWFQSDKIPYLDQHGRITGLIVVSTDITDRRNLEEVVRRAERDHRNILDSVNAMIWYMDRAGRVTRANRQAAAHCGMSVQDMLGRTVHDLFPPEFARAYDRDIRDVLVSRRAKLGTIEPGPYPDGKTGWFKTDKIPYLDNLGVMIGMTIMVEDITLHKRTQDELAASEERFRALVETTSDCIFEYDADFRFTYNSPALAHILGYTPQELQGRSPADLSPPDEVARILAEIGPDLEAHRPFRNLLQRCRHKDGREVQVEVSAVPIMVAGGRFAGYRGITRDVTERERAAAALRASEERFRALVETTSDCIWEHGPDLRITYMSPQCFDILGFLPEEMLGKTPLDVTVPEEVPALLEEVGPLLDRREPFRGVIQHCLGKDGRLVALESSGSPAYDPAGGFIGYHGVSRDVTARERAAAALRESEERLRKLVENIPVLIHAYDGNNQYVFWNRESERVLGYTAREVIGDPAVRDKIYPDPDALALFRQWHGNSREYRDVEIPMSCKDGVRRIISWTSVSETCPLPGWGMWETGVDVTAAREAQERLRQSHEDLERRVEQRTAELARAEARYRSIYENAPVGIFQKTLQGRFLAANEQLARIYGYDSPEALMAEAADAPAALYVDPAAWEAMRRLLSRQDRLENFEVLVRRVDGRLAWTSRMIRVVRDAGGNAVFYEGFVSDVTSRRQAEEQVHALTRELLRAQESERQRISRELHDNMAQTLSSLAIAWKTMFDGHPETPPDVRQRAEGLAGHLSGLIRSVRDLAYDLRPLALDELGLSRAVRMHCEEFADQTGLDVEFSAAGLDALPLDTDTAINIFRLVQEALRNVAKHAGAGRVGVKLVASHPHILVRVEDDGQGFDPAERRAQTGQRRMGLQSMEERVLLLGGTFRVHSRPGQGTRIFAEIPVLDQLGGR